jgi:hypothetical protein
MYNPTFRDFNQWFKQILVGLKLKTTFRFISIGSIPELKEELAGTAPEFPWKNVIAGFRPILPGRGLRWQLTESEAVQESQRSKAGWVAGGCWGLLG